MAQVHSTRAMNQSEKQGVVTCNTDWKNISKIFVVSPWKWIKLETTPAHTLEHRLLKSTKYSAPSTVPGIYNIIIILFYIITQVILAFW